MSVFRLHDTNILLFYRVRIIRVKKRKFTITIASLTLFLLTSKNCQHNYENTTIIFVEEVFIRRFDLISFINFLLR